MQPGQRYSVSFTNADASCAPRFETIAEALDYAQDNGLLDGSEVVIRDYEGGRPALAVRLAAV